MKPIRQFAHIMRAGLNARTRVPRPVRLSAVLVGVLFVLSSQFWAQQPDTTANCTSLFSPGCENASAPQGTTVIPTPSNPGSLPNPALDRSNNSVYIDRGGIAETASSPYQTRPNLFPPDPVTDLQRLARSSTGEQLQIFGRDLFQNVPSTFAPGDQLAVPADYIIGPQDELLVRLWGPPEAFNSQLTVDRSGSIYIPKVGAIHVAGLRFDELQRQIQDAANRVYRNFSLTVNLGRLRSIQIYVVGEARRPGAYTISSLSTVLNGLFASGGPNVQGSMRHIQVRRTGSTTFEFDLYDLVLRGDKSKDIRLEQGDTIFIPPVGAQAALAGSVRHPAIYELMPGSTLGDILKIAGGLSSTASSTEISLERIEDDRTRHAMTVALDRAGDATALHDGDVVFAGHISAGYQKSVTIRGNLANPGRFAWHPGMRLSEIIPDRSSLLTGDYWRERNRLGVPVPLFEPIQSATRAGTNNGNQGTITENGRPVSSSQWDNQSDLNQNPSSQQYPTSQQNPTGQQNPTTQQNIPGQNNPRDAVGLATAGVVDQTTQAARDSERRPQAYGTDAQSANPKQNLIRIAAPEIDWSYAVIERLNPDTLKSSLVPFNLGKLVQDHDPAQNLELQPGDVVTIMSQNDIQVPQEARTKYVRLEGEFPAAGVYSVLPNETLDQLVQRAGGLTSKAYLYGSSFSRASARVYQQQRLDEYISTLAADLERSAAVRSASSTTGIVDPNALAEQQSLVAQLRALRATGRVVLEFAPTSNGVGVIPSIPLENDDVFEVPSKPDTVSVIGAVYGQNIFLYNEKRTLRDYVALAGKPNRIADRKHAFIIRADGSIFSRERAQGVWTNNFDESRINPGDTIVIPEKPIRPSALRQLVDISQIVSSFGLAAAAIYVIH